MNIYCDISDITETINPSSIIQGKVIDKSIILKTKHNTPYFWCIIRDKHNKIDSNKSEPNEIKIMFWHPFAKAAFETMKKGNVYDFRKMSIKKTCRQYHPHSYQLTMTKETTMKRKQTLNVFKNGILCNDDANNLTTKFQVNIKHYFKKL